MGVSLGFGGRVTHARTAELRDAARSVPSDRILVETDCPYLVPRPCKDRDNEPANLRYVIEALAELRGQTPDQLAAVTAANARKVFGVGE